ncbi:MAG TPA: type II toxin-antitoxin system HipA family toxin YjjJ [Ideonella sp.]|uniref:type II toxin-antitoxin system HipA family toxin YjjJ n=1 Tax=Ideonella sp. TaxID=1929293 RepID=UPI002C8CDDD5|nr:type II toxin-antitoxin system HipA family toxin YjjJ [Ideonella sp.]HSI50871.1 type II toxin-antitoxin system HipA family toxin YjjJ [Ideonella sp.]
MRPRNQPARDRLLPLLGRLGPSSAAALAQALDVSVPTLHRLLQEQAGQVLSAGKARRARHALRRGLRGVVGDSPLYQVDVEGRAEQVGQLALLRPQGAWLQLPDGSWPVPEASRDGWWDGLPYPLLDMRPEGYMGRQFARRQHQALAVPADPETWSDDDVVHVLSQRGWDASGQWILGEPAMALWQAERLAPATPLRPAVQGAAYAALADEAVASGVPGSSAAGEFPKFAALRELDGSATPHVLVKFSGADAGSSTVQRWADLLVCEHLALACAGTLPGAEPTRSRVLGHAGRTFLEVERFDRHGRWGRSGLVSLGTLDAALLGDGSSDWTRLAARLAAEQWLAAEALPRVEVLWWFGRLIANTDMHTGNLSFRPAPTSNAAAKAGLQLAPAYDMLPMLYAPLAGGELPPRQFEPALPLPPQRTVWQTACTAALAFWQMAAEDSRISPAFRATCKQNRQRLEAVAALA